MLSPNTPGKTKNPSLSSAESNKTPTAVSPPAGEGFSETQMAQLASLLQPLGKSLSHLEKKVGHLEKKVGHLEKKVGLLVEEKARKMVARQFGEDFNRSFIIKSPHDLVKLLANGNVNKMEKSDYEARNQAVEKLVKILKDLLPSFGKVAVEKVNEELKNNALFQNNAFDKAKNDFQENVIEPIKKAKELDSLNWTKIYGVTLQVVKDLSCKKLDGEDEDAWNARVKAMNARFKRKLQRLKAAVEKNDLSSCDSLTIMLLSAFADAGPDIWESEVPKRREWIENNCNVFDFKEVIECDLMPSVKAVTNHATIEVGEIKSSMTGFAEAWKQMLYIANIIHLALLLITGKNFKSVAKTGYLYVLEAGENDQHLSLDVHSGMSFFVYKAF